MKKALILVLALAMLAFSFTAASAEAPSGDYLGKPLPDFTVETADGGTFTLSEALKEKEMVLINLWATWCGPCEMEFPYLQEAYEQYQDRVAVVALSIEPADTPEKLAAYAGEHGMTFPVANGADTGLDEYLDVMYIPTSVVVDRFGNVCMAEANSQTSAQAFTGLFDLFLGEDYTETRVLDGFPKPKASVAAEDAGNLGAAVGMPVKNPEDPSLYPFLTGETDGRKCIRSSNAGMDDSMALVDVPVTAAAGDALCLDLKVSSESIFDAAVISVNGDEVKRFSGETGWISYAVPLREGENLVTLGYEKDSGAEYGEDTVYFADFRLLSGSAAQEALAANPVYPFAAETRLNLVSEGAREIVFEETEEGAMEAFFGMPAVFCVVNGETAEFEVAIGPETNPDTAVLYCLTNGMVWTPDEFNAGAVSVPVESLDTSGFSFGVVVLTDVRSGESSAMIVYCADEENADALAAELADYGLAAGYVYADGGEKDSRGAEAAEPVWTVVFADQNGDPVPGCVALFCTDVNCTTVVADDNGRAEFHGEPFAYHVQVLTVPDGYSVAPGAEFTMEESGGTVTVDVTKG